MELETETIRWYREVLRSIGWKGLITQYNYSKRLAESSIRFRESDLLTFNTYFCHPGGTGATAPDTFFSTAPSVPERSTCAIWPVRA